MQDMTTVVIQDSQLMQVSRMSHVFSAEQGYFVAFCPFQVTEFFAYCGKFVPCIAIADLAPAEARSEATWETIRGHRLVKCIVRSDDLSDREIENLLIAGCWGVIEKNADQTLLRKAVDAVAHDE